MAPKSAPHKLVSEACESVGASRDRCALFCGEATQEMLQAVTQLGPGIVHAVLDRLDHMMSRGLRGWCALRTEVPRARAAGSEAARGRSVERSEHHAAT